MKKLVYVWMTALVSLLSSCSDFSSVEDTSGGSLNGSYSSMVTVGKYLYTVSKEELSTFEITNPAEPKILDKQHVGFMIENLYHVNGILFIGSQTAMHIFSIGNDGLPLKRSTTNYSVFGEEFLPCDPVVSDGKFAYATLSSVFEGPCSRWDLINELRAYDVKNLESPILVSTTQMKSPKGLSINGNDLYVCEEANGLSIFDINDRNIPQLIKTINDCNCYDVIVKNNLLLAVGKNEIFQYSIGPNHAIQKLQTIKI